MLNVILCKCRYKVVAMIVIWLHAEIDFLVRGFGRLYKILWEKLFLLVEVVTGSNINQDVYWTFECFHEFGSIMFFPFCLVLLSEIAFERFLAPRTFNRIGNWRKSRT